MRKAGVGAIKSKTKAAALYKEKISELSENDFLTHKRQMATLKDALEEFAHKHSDKIKSNAEFRKQFQAMCANIGVDPISSSKGNWSCKLNLGDFYYKLSIRIIEVCVASQKSNGGLMDLDTVCKILNTTKNKYASDVSIDDIEQSIKQVSCFGSGFCILKPPNSRRRFIQSLPLEISNELTFVLGLAEETKGCLSKDLCMKE